MREILFRGQRIDVREWVYGVPIVKYGNLYIIDPEMSFMSTTYNQPAVFDFITRVYQVDPSTVGQYTGLTDKNGKKIFEGDIIEVNDRTNGGELIGWVSYDDEDTEYQILYEENDVCGLGSCYMQHQIEVIGNIHDNPELVGGVN